MTDSAPSPRSTLIRTVPLRVLIVDDHQDSADILAVMLETRGYTPCAAYSFADALARALEFAPDLAFLDLSLGAHTGYELVEAFRAHASLDTCRLVALTGHADEATRLRCAAAGFHARLVKPVFLESLLEVLAALQGSAEAPETA